MVEGTPAGLPSVRLLRLSRCACGRPRAAHLRTWRWNGTSLAGGVPKEGTAPIWAASRLKSVSKAGSARFRAKPGCKARPDRGGAHFRSAFASCAPERAASRALRGGAGADPARPHCVSARLHDGAHDHSASKGGPMNLVMETEDGRAYVSGSRSPARSSPTPATAATASRSADEDGVLRRQQHQVPDHRHRDARATRCPRCSSPTYARRS